MSVSVSLTSSLFDVSRLHLRYGENAARNCKASGWVA